MNKFICILLIFLCGSLLVFAQMESSSPQFTKEELLAFKDVRHLLSAMKHGKDYSQYIVRNFSLSILVRSADSTQVKLSETGPGGQWSSKQKNMIQKCARKGVVFTLENILMVEPGKKGLANEPPVSFSIRE